jgi:valyl-tRNA synthetase
LDFIKNSPYISPAEKKIAIKAKKKEFPDGIEKCGSDALRFALLAYMVQSGDINLNVERIESYRRMCNKIWQTIRFSANNFKGDFTPDFGLLENTQGMSLLNQWILSRLSFAAKTMNEHLVNYKFGFAT